MYRSVPPLPTAYSLVIDRGRFMRIYLVNMLQRLAVASLFTLLISLALQAQGPSPTVIIPQRGVTPIGSYAITDIETVDTVNGNLSLRLPITSLASGRTGTTASLSLVYNSSMYAWNGPQLVNSDFIS